MSTTFQPRALSASSIKGDEVKNYQGEKIGKIEDIVVDIQLGKIAYAVMSFGGFLGIGEKYFAIPWSKLQLDAEEENLKLDISKEVLKKAEGFDKDHWPQMTGDWHYRTYQYYGIDPYWDN